MTPVLEVDISKVYISFNVNDQTIKLERNWLFTISVPLHILVTFTSSDPAGTYLAKICISVFIYGE